MNRDRAELSVFAVLLLFYYWPYYIRLYQPSSLCFYFSLISSLIYRESLITWRTVTYRLIDVPLPIVPKFQGMYPLDQTHLFYRLLRQTHITGGSSNFSNIASIRIALHSCLIHAQSLYNNYLQIKHIINTLSYGIIME